MAITQKDEARALNTDERTLVEQSHHPALQALPDEELYNLVRLMRDRREKAKTQANQRRREMRGKSAPKGASASRGDEGSKFKLAILAMAVRRLNSEVERRHRMAARLKLRENAERALALKQTKETSGQPINMRHAHEGMRNLASTRQQDLIRPMELGRQRKAAAIAQAKRDAH